MLTKVVFYVKAITEKRAYIEEYKKMKIFNFMSVAEILYIVENSNLSLYSNGEKIVTQGDIAHNIIIVIKGTVQVNVMQEGKEVYICSIGENELLGEAGIFLRVKRTANIVSLDDSVILEIPRSTLMDFFREKPSTGNKLLLVIVHGLLKKLRVANQDLAFEKVCDTQIGDVDTLIAELTGEK